MQSQTLRARLLCTIAAAAVIAAVPASVDFTKSGWTVQPSYAFAKDGRDDDRGGSDRGGRSGKSGSGRSGSSDDSTNDSDDDDSDDDDSDDDRGGNSGSGKGGSSNSGSGGGDDDSDDVSDDDGDDDSGRGRGRGRGRGGDDNDDDNDDDDHAGVGGTKVEISRGSIEVEQPNGAKEEIEDGRYERKDASGRTVEERPATQADIDRLRGMAGPGVVAATRKVGSGSVAKVEISRDGIEVVNNDGTKEEIENGRYQRKDAMGRTVEERPATQADVDRLQLVARGARPQRHINVGAIAKIERSSAGLEIVYATGWKEEFESGRYELKDPNGNTVVERTATEQDRARMTRLAGG